jgi:hypothetical protein
VRRSTSIKKELEQQLLQWKRVKEEQGLLKRGDKIRIGSKWFEILNIRWIDNGPYLFPPFPSINSNLFRENNDKELLLRASNGIERWTKCTNGVGNVWNKIKLM